MTNYLEEIPLKDLHRIANRRRLEMRDMKNHDTFAKKTEELGVYVDEIIKRGEKEDDVK